MSSLLQDLLDDLHRMPHRGVAPDLEGAGACGMHPDRDAVSRCGHCGRTNCRGSEVLVCSRPYCSECVLAGRQALQAASRDMSREPRWVSAFFAGLAAAVAGAIVWERVAYFLDIQSGFVAMIMGLGVGLAVVSGSGRKRGPGLRWLAVVLTLLSVGLGVLFQSHSAVAARNPRVPDATIWLFCMRCFPTVVVQMNPMRLGAITLSGLVAAWLVPRGPSFPSPRE